METITDNEYKSIKNGILEYGLNIAFLMLYRFEKTENYENCQILDESIRRFCNDINLKYTKESEEEIYNQYSEEMKNNIPVYLKKFKDIFTRFRDKRLNINPYKNEIT